MTRYRTSGTEGSEKSRSVSGGRLKLRALVKRPASIRRYLSHLGESTEAPPLSPARDPPYFRSRVLRRKLGELEEQSSQVELLAS